MQYIYTEEYMICKARVMCLAVFLLTFCFAILLSAVLGTIPTAAQDTKESALELTELEQLKLSVLMKDVLLANQQLQLIQMQFKEAAGKRDAKQRELEATLGRLRVTHKVPVDKFNFDPERFRFIPILEKEKSEERGGDSL